MTILTKEQETLSAVMSSTEKKTKRNETKRPFHSNERRRSLHAHLSSATSSSIQPSLKLTL